MIPVASARSRQFPPRGTARLAVATAHAIFSGAGRSFDDRLSAEWDIASAIFLTREKLSVQREMRMTASATSERSSSACSCAVRRRNLDVPLIGDTFARRTELAYQIHQFSVV